MKIKKLFAVLMVVMLTVCTGVMLAACGPDPEPTPEKASYQLIGQFKEDLGALMGDGFDFLLNLKSDETAVLDRYTPGSYNVSDAETNTGFKASFMSGTWKETKKDGVDCLQIKLAVVAADGTSSSAVTCYAYDVAGTYSFELNFPIVPGQSFTRNVTLSGNKTIIYADANAFIQGMKRTFTAPASVVTFRDETNNGTAYVQEDGTLLIYNGYNKAATGKWGKSTAGTAITFITQIGESKVTATMDGNKATFAYSYDVGYNNMKIEFVFVCNDISALSNKAINPTYVGTTKTSYGGVEYDKTNTIELISATEFIYSGSVLGNAAGAATGTYTLVGNVLTLTVVTGAMDDLVWTVNSTTFTMTVATSS